MRTKTVEMVIDRGFWALLLILPMLAYIVANHHGSVDFATINPAENLGIGENRGSIKLGKNADFAVLDADFNVLMTIRNGHVIYKR